MRRPHLPHGLFRPNLRQSWNKYNVWNIRKQVGRELPVNFGRTFFQQKWSAKSRTRAYHGDHIGEKKWKRLFSRRLISTVDMPPKYLAAYDGSEQSAGRGSGLTTSNVTAHSYSAAPELSSLANRSGADRGGPFSNPNKMVSEHFSQMTPYMQMTYAPLERRLDTAVFRAMFASSVRQARQFIVHGSVTVNGHKMVHPSYALNPGDMFQVEVEKVMYATGHPKTSKRDMQIRGAIDARKKAAKKLHQTEAAQVAQDKPVAEGQSAVEGGGEAVTAAAEATEAAAEGEEAAGKSEDAETESLQDEDAVALSPEETWRKNERSLKFILSRVRAVLLTNARDLSARDKKRLRMFRDEAKSFLSHPEDSDLDAQELVEQLQLQMKSHEMMRDSFEKLELAEDKQAAGEAGEAGEASEATEGATGHNRQRQIDKGLEGLSEEQKAKAVEMMKGSQLSRDDMRQLGRLLVAEEENPFDDTKPYATPWRPRPFMKVFAFIPRYLEVNPNICAAVYLRHPVARKGMAEVPTPFSYLTNQLAHNWYLERG